MIDRYCEHCKKPFLAKSDNVRRGWGRFCGKVCAGLAQGLSSPIARLEVLPTPAEVADDTARHRDAIRYQLRVNESLPLGSILLFCTECQGGVSAAKCRESGCFLFKHRAAALKEISRQ